MYGVLSRLIYDNEIVGIRVVVYKSCETGKNEVLDIDIETVEKLNIPYEYKTLDEVSLELKNGVLVDNKEYKGETAKCIEDLYTSQDNFYKDLYINEDGHISNIEREYNIDEYNMRCVKRVINSYRYIELDYRIKDLKKQILAVDEYLGDDVSDSIDMECMRLIRLQYNDELDMLKRKRENIYG